MTSCAILGASGHGKVVAELAELNGYTDVVFFDDRWPQLQVLEHWVVVGNTQSLLTTIRDYDIVLVAIGDNVTRLNKQKLLTQAGANFEALIHPSASVSQYANIGDGTVIMANAVVNPFSRIGTSCIINTSASVDHDCVISDGVHISPGAHLAGAVNIGIASWVGIGARVRQLTSIGEHVVVGAGATVVQNIADNQVVIGTPAKTVK